jgi:glycerol uptake facilitator-like aquaporin
VTARRLVAEFVGTIATTDRTDGTLLGGEVLATFGLLVVIFGVVRSGNMRAVPGAVGAYIAAAQVVVPRRSDTAAVTASADPAGGPS